MGPSINYFALKFSEFLIDFQFLVFLYHENDKKHRN